MTRGMLRPKGTASLIVATVAGMLGTALFLSSLGVHHAPSASAVVPTPTPAPECLVAADLDVVIIIDRSGSMISNLTGGKTRLQWAKDAALALVNGIAGAPDSPTLGNSHVEVITFGGGSASVVRTFSSDATAVRAAINGITNPPSNTDTAIAPAMTQATSDPNAHIHGGDHGSYRVVVLLSDGRNYANGDLWYGTTCDTTHTRRQNTVDAIPNLHAAADTVYTISIGDATTCGPTHDQLCPADSCNPSELDEYLLVDIVGGSSRFLHKCNRCCHSSRHLQWDIARSDKHLRRLQRPQVQRLGV